MKIVMHHSVLICTAHKLYGHRCCEFLHSCVFKDFDMFAGSLLNESSTHLCNTTMTTSENGFTDKE